jgi:hypothetical protein
MSKYYFACGTLELIWSTNHKPLPAACGFVYEKIKESDDEHELDEYIYIDERGFRGFDTADNTTVAIQTEKVLRLIGFIK